MRRSPEDEGLGLSYTVNTGDWPPATTPTLDSLADAINAALNSASLS